VYYAIDSQGNAAAVKVLHEEIRNIPGRLQGFRRGVRSMEILSRRGVEGMVSYTDSSEIPAFVAMPWIQGPTLHEAAQQAILRDWDTVLNVANSLTGIVRRAHSLPERVLHRDLRPSNIMLENYYIDDEDWKLVVLDFDLSWHRDAPEQSVHESSVSGYLAPEQLRRVVGVSSRNALVDSFGLGMTLFFLSCGVDPSPGQHLASRWAEEVQRAVSTMLQPRWISTPARYARVVIGSTYDTQAARWDVGQIQGELERLRGANLDPTSVQSAELLTEEIAARTDVARAYEWNADELTATVDLPTGLRIVLTADEPRARIQLSISWRSTGVHDRSGVSKYVDRQQAHVRARLDSSVWAVEEARSGLGDFHIEAHLASETAVNVEGAAAAVDDALESLRFGTV
jgi:serine/threonine protein kinase